MILYINGDSHSAAGEAVNDHCPVTKKCSTFFPDNVPLGYIEGRIIKK